MTGFLIFLHATVCVLLTMVILMQAGRGGGLTAGFASAESMFGARTNEFMVRATIVLMSIFLLTSLGLAFLSSRKEKSLIPANIATKKLPDITIPINATVQNPEQQEDLSMESKPIVNGEAPQNDTSSMPTELPVSAEPIPSSSVVDNRVQQ